MNSVIKYRNYLLKLFFVGGFFILGIQAQAQEVHVSLDRDTIKIGEQVDYTLQIDHITEKDKVVFPQGQAFRPLILVDSTAVDTLRQKKEKSFILQRKIPLTQFDPGNYMIPSQTIIVNGEGYYSDSIPLVVNKVVVDTTKQKLFPIKDALNIKPSTKVPNWIWWGLGVALLILLIYLFLKGRKRILEKRKELPPYEKAIQTLRTLDEKQDLESGRYKDYYSSLTDAIKRYVDEKIDERALESTTDEFIALLKSFKKEKQIYLKEQVIGSLEAIFRRADLVKFAGISSDKLTAREDRKTIEENINAFDGAIPEPTEEEKMKDEAYRRQKEKALRKRRLRWGLLGLVIVVFIGGGIFLWQTDFGKNTFFAPSTQKLLKQEWITSEYGPYGMTVTTPRVLLRQMDSIPKIFPNKSKYEDHFKYGDFTGHFLIEVVNVRFKEKAEIDSIDVGHLINHAFDRYKVSNMILKNRDFTTLDNVSGQEVSGSLTIQRPNGKEKYKKEYTFLAFTQLGGVQELLISYDADDQQGEEIKDRVINSVEFKDKPNGNR